jgi:hypothetical protein
MPPLLHMADISLVALQKVARAEFYLNIACWIVHPNFHIVEIG